MTVLLYLLALPLASDLIASLLGLRDGGLIAWKLVRILLVTLLLLSLILWLDDPATHAIGAAFGTILCMQLIGYFAWRSLAIGTRRS